MDIPFRNSFFQQEELGDLRSICLRAKLVVVFGYRLPTKSIYFGKEIAYNYLEITERLYTFSWIKFKKL
jgi:hypothetical protein